MKIFVWHPYHLVNPSPWPCIGACAAFVMAAGGVAYFHYGQIWLFLVGAVTLNLIMIVW